MSDKIFFIFEYKNVIEKSRFFRDLSSTISIFFHQFFNYKLINLNYLELSDELDLQIVQGHHQRIFCY